MRGLVPGARPRSLRTRHLRPKAFPAGRAVRAREILDNGPRTRAPFGSEARRQSAGRPRGRGGGRGSTGGTRSTSGRGPRNAGARRHPRSGGEPRHRPRPSTPARTPHRTRRGKPDSRRAIRPRRRGTSPARGIGCEGSKGSSTTATGRIRAAGTVERLKVDARAFLPLDAKLTRRDRVTGSGENVKTFLAEEFAPSAGRR